MQKYQDLVGFSFSIYILNVYKIWYIRMNKNMMTTIYSSKNKSKSLNTNSEKLTFFDPASNLRRSFCLFVMGQPFKIYLLSRVPFITSIE